jgi:hypothetical protein
MLVSVFYTLGGIVYGIVAILFIGFADTVNEVPLAREATGFVVALAAIFIVISLIHFAITYGIWNITQWGWIGGLVTSGLYGVIWLLGSIEGDALAIVFLLLSVAVIGYLGYQSSLFRGTSQPAQQPPAREPRDDRQQRRRRGGQQGQQGQYAQQGQQGQQGQRGRQNPGGTGESQDDGWDNSRR